MTGTILPEEPFLPPYATSSPPIRQTRSVGTGRQLRLVQDLDFSASELEHEVLSYSAMESSMNQPRSAALRAAAARA